MTETPPPTSDPAEIAARLRMPLVDAMETQRAVRRLDTSRPVDHDLLLRVLELSLKAPTSSNTQDWTYVVVEDPEQKARVGAVYRRLYRLFNPIVTRQAKGDAQALRNMAPGQWQAEHFAEIPVFVIPCYRKNTNHRPTGRPQIRVSSFYGSVYPAVQNLLLTCSRGRARCVTPDAADLVDPVDPQDPRAATHGRARVHHPDRLGEGSLRADATDTDR